jgi:hypothetical protein
MYVAIACRCKIIKYNRTTETPVRRPSYVCAEQKKNDNNSVGNLKLDI